MSNDGVAAVEKALSLLDCFQPGKESLSLAALSLMSGDTIGVIFNFLSGQDFRYFLFPARPCIKGKPFFFIHKTGINVNSFAMKRD